MHNCVIAVYTSFSEESEKQEKSSSHSEFYFISIFEEKGFHGCIYLLTDFKREEVKNSYHRFFLFV